MKMEESIRNGRGETMQQQHEKSKAMKAVLFVPNFKERLPPSTQEIPPIPIIENDKTGTLSFTAGYNSEYVVNITGTNAQNAYNSHIWPK